jgi:hypothetical protein
MSIQSLIIAANGSVPSGPLRPRNCHEAVFGWLIQSMSSKYCQPGEGGVEEAWSVLRALRQAHTDMPRDPQLSGRWVARHLYCGPRVYQVSAASSALLAAGDVVFMGHPREPHHSMVVVEQHGSQRLARGFNNAGCFNGPSYASDPVLRDLADPSRWTGAGHDVFKANNGGCELRRMSYEDIMRNIPATLDF